MPGKRLRIRFDVPGIRGNRPCLRTEREHKGSAETKGEKGWIAMEKLLTVTVPAYNAEQYLSANLESMLSVGDFFHEDMDRETRDYILNRLEILVIDDGSTDRTAQTADGFQERFPHTIRVIHKENGGHGSGINAGIQNARGRYFKVVDADDWVDPSAFFQLLRFLETTEDDVVSSGFYWRRENGQEDCRTFPKKRETEEPFPGVRYRHSYRFHEVADHLYLKMHNLTIRTEILRKEQVVIDEHCFYVDSEFILYPILGVDTISFLQEVVYQYRVGRAGQSVTPERMKRNERQYDHVLQQLLGYYQTRVCAAGIPEYKKKYVENIISRLIAGRIKLLLSRPIGFGSCRSLVSFDRRIRKNYPEIYAANFNRAVSLLRLCPMIVYWPAAVSLRLSQPAYEKQ